MARRKGFPCGHVGLGSYCHRCEQEERSAAERRSVTVERGLQYEVVAYRWDELFPGQRGECHKFQLPVAQRAVELAEELLLGNHYSVLGGHRMPCDGTRVRFKLPGANRLVGRLVARDEVADLRVMTHARYNRFYRE